MTDFYVYKLLRPWDNVPCYIGKGRGDRSNAHRRAGARHKNRHLAGVYKRAAATPVPVVIVAEGLTEGLTEDEAFALEIKLIAEIGRLDLHAGSLCNHTNGGEGNSGTVFSTERRAKIGAGHAGKTVSAESRQKMRDAKAGKRMSAATCAKMSASRTGVARSPETRSRIADSVSRTLQARYVPCMTSPPWLKEQ